MRCHMDIGCSTTCSIFHNFENSVRVFAGDVTAVVLGLSWLEVSNVAVYHLYAMRKFRAIKCLELNLKKWRIGTCQPHIHKITSDQGEIQFKFNRQVRSILNNNKLLQVIVRYVESALMSY